MKKIASILCCLCLMLAPTTMAFASNDVAQSDEVVVMPRISMSCPECRGRTVPISTGKNDAYWYFACQNCNAVIVIANPNL